MRLNATFSPSSAATRRRSRKSLEHNMYSVTAAVITTTICTVYTEYSSVCAPSVCTRCPPENVRCLHGCLNGGGRENLQTPGAIAISYTRGRPDMATHGARWSVLTVLCEEGPFMVQNRFVTVEARLRHSLVARVGMREGGRRGFF